MRYAIIDATAGKVINIVEYDPAPSNPPPGFGAGIIAVQSDKADMSLTWNGTALVPPAPPAPAAAPIPDISHRQFYQQLSVQGVITQTQALAAVQTGTLPPSLQTIVDSLPAADQFPATMLLCGADSFDRGNPMTTEIGAAYGWTPAQIDTFFQAAALL